MKKIIVNEEALKLLKESEEEVTFFEFYNNVKDFLKQLLSNPCGAEPAEFFSIHGISKGGLKKILIDKGVITKKERIDEPFDEENGKQVSRYYVSYKIPRKDFKKKIMRVYQNLFEV